MAADPTVPPLPLVVQLGFAGTRSLYDSADHRVSDPMAFKQSVGTQLTTILARLPAELGLSSRHFFCGISQIAVGGDTAFTEACAALGIRQRIFLPQPLDEYLHAGESKDADFSPAQQAEARDLAQLPHIIQQRVVSSSNDRHERFSDANMEVARISNLVVGLVRADQIEMPGGTLELIKIAENRGLPVLVVTIGVENGLPVLMAEWRGKARFVLPTAPHPLESLPAAETGPMAALPEAAAFAGHLLHHASELAKVHHGLFKTAAFIIIGTHILATFCAVSAVQFHETLAHTLVWFLILELLLIGCGFAVHQLLHRREASQQWAAARLIAELGRSVAALGRQPSAFAYLFQLPFPDRFRPLLHTLHVLHLVDTSRPDGKSWQGRLANYLACRLDGSNGQIAFYTSRSKHAARWLRLANTAFNCCSGGAFIAVCCKLFHMGGQYGILVFGSLAIVMPVLAVAALSLAAAFDLEARKQTFSDMRDFLTAQRALLARATADREFCQLVVETEFRLLGETVNWYSRRAFTGVA